VGNTGQWVTGYFVATRCEWTSFSSDAMIRVIQKLMLTTLATKVAHKKGAGVAFCGITGVKCELDDANNDGSGIQTQLICRWQHVVVSDGIESVCRQFEVCTGDVYCSQRGSHDLVSHQAFPHLLTLVPPAICRKHEMI
jgi:hypothetical protein